LFRFTIQATKIRRANLSPTQ
jgi:hypothetical protein